MKKIVFLFLVCMITYSTYSQVEIIAHRGASYLAPENTLAASNLAWKLGADAVEVDIYLSKDNKIMCIHDPDTKRTSGQNFKVSETDSKELRKLDVGSFKSGTYKGEKIPFLKEIIKSVPEGKELVVEIKCRSEVLPYLLEDVNRYNKKIRFVFICFDLQTIADTKKTFPANKCYWLCSNSLLLNQNLEKTVTFGLDGVSLVYGIIDKKTATRINDLGLELFTWTVDDPAEVKRLISLGVKGITTNRPGWLRDQIF